MNLIQRIRELPPEIQDLIGEYNVEHRAQTRRLRDEYFALIYKTCCVCRVATSNDHYCPTDYFLYSKHGLGHYWCSKRCLDAETDDSRLRQYLTAIANYLKSSVDLIR